MHNYLYKTVMQIYIYIYIYMRNQYLLPESRRCSNIPDGTKLALSTIDDIGRKKKEKNCAYIISDT